MILFYFENPDPLLHASVEFQFHYDLILFSNSPSQANLVVIFQFHYDLILFYINQYVLH